MKKIFIWAFILLSLTLLVIPALAATPSTARVYCSDVTAYNTGELIPTGVDVGYIYKWGTVSGNYSEYRDAGWDQTNYEMTNLVPGTTYYISMRAYTSLDEESGDSPDYLYFHAGAPNSPVYRLRSLKTAGAYLYTISESEKNSIVSNYSTSWILEGPAFYAFPANHQ